jgi:hypothetical protein
MRGCLFVVLLGLAVLGGAAWFAGPPIAGVVVTTTLTAGGMTAGTLDVDVETDPPIAVAVGRIDRLTITAEDVAWNDLTAASMDLELTDVDLLARTADETEGRFVDVVIEAADGEPVLVDIDFAGPAEAAATSVAIDRASAQRLAAGAFEAQLGIAPESVDLIAPSTIRFSASGSSVDGRLAVTPNGAIEASTPLGTFEVFDGGGLPLELTGVAVGPDGLQVTGLLDISSLLN